MAWTVFIVLAVLTIGGALGVVVTRNVVHAALALLVSLIAVAGVYLVLSVEFLAMPSSNLLYNPTKPQPVGYRFAPPKDLNSLFPVHIARIYHFLSHSKEGITDLIGNVSFAGYSMLPGAKYFVDTDIPFGTKPSVYKYMVLHSVEELCIQLHGLITSGVGSAEMSKIQLYGRAIYMHP